MDVRAHAFGRVSGLQEMSQSWSTGFSRRCRLKAGPQARVWHGRLGHDSMGVRAHATGKVSQVCRKCRTVGDQENRTLTRAG